MGAHNLIGSCLPEVSQSLEVENHVIGSLPKNCVRRSYTPQYVVRQRHNHLPTKSLPKKDPACFVLLCTVKYALFWAAKRSHKTIPTMSASGQQETRGM